VVAGVFWLLGARHLARDTMLAPTRFVGDAASWVSAPGRARQWPPTPESR
jgi:hypothetical protein